MSNRPQQTDRNKPLKITIRGTAAQIVRDTADAMKCTRGSLIESYIFHGSGVPGKPVLEPFGVGSAITTEATC